MDGRWLVLSGRAEVVLPLSPGAAAASAYVAGVMMICFRVLGEALISPSLPLLFLLLLRGLRVTLVNSPSFSEFVFERPLAGSARARGAGAGGCDRCAVLTVGRGGIGGGGMVSRSRALSLAVRGARACWMTAVSVSAKFASLLVSLGRLRGRGVWSIVVLPACVCAAVVLPLMGRGTLGVGDGEGSVVRPVVLAPGTGTQPRGVDPGDAASLKARGGMVIFSVVLPALLPLGCGEGEGSAVRLMFDSVVEGGRPRGVTEGEGVSLAERGRFTLWGVEGVFLPLGTDPDAERLLPVEGVSGGVSVSRSPLSDRWRPMLSADSRKKARFLAFAASFISVSSAAARLSIWSAFHCLSVSSTSDMAAFFARRSNVCLDSQYQSL
jgi:hypothetical protein